MLLDIIILIIVFFSIYLSGIAVTCHFLPNSDGIEKVALSFAFGVMVIALQGLCIALLPNYKQTVAILFLVFNAIVFLYLCKIGKINIRLELNRAEKITIAFWPFAIIIILQITKLPFGMPANLFDGPYVFKNHNLHVKIQTINGHLPADNYVPYVASEFMLRNISFVNERPMLPGQEVVNRTFLMPLVTNVFRAALDPPPRQTGSLGTFEYIGSKWPDVGKLGDDKYYSQFLVVGVFLNTLLYLGFLYLIRCFGLSHIAIVSSLILLSSPYFISQAMFTWPKSFGGFFLIICACLISQRKHYAVAGLMLGLGYHCHPFAAGFGLFFGLYLVWLVSKDLASRRDLIEFSIVALVIVIPWLVWTKLVLQISGDLIAQNMFAVSSVKEFFWIRIFNLYNFVMPTMFSSQQFVSWDFFQRSLVSIPGIVGLIMVIPAYKWCENNYKTEAFWVWIFVLLPSWLMWIVFSVPNVPGLHGFQTIFPFLVLMAIKWMYEKLPSKVFVSLVTLQILINLSSLYSRGSDLMAL